MPIKKTTTQSAQQTGKKGIEIYVDGSFIDGRVGYGLVILRDGVSAGEFSGSVENEEYLSARQVAGELFAVGKALQWCKINGEMSVTIYYDYTGIECWATGKWKAKLPLTQRYTAFVRSSGIRISWQKVAAHTGDFWNERADELAKQGTVEVRS